jgi:hypothetical protein
MVVLYVERTGVVVVAVDQVRTPVGPSVVPRAINRHISVRRLSANAERLEIGS